METYSPESQSNYPNPVRKPSAQTESTQWPKTIAVFVTWIVLIVGLSAIAAAIFMNPRVPVLLYAFYGVYFAIFLWLLYSTFRSAYLQMGPLTHAYWICAGCILATVAVVVLTFLTAPNSGEMAFVAAITLCVSLVLSPVIAAVFLCFIRGNFIMPDYMKGKKASQSQLQKGVDEPDHHHHQYHEGENGISHHQDKMLSQV